MDKNLFRHLRHEMRTYLNQVMGYSEMLREDSSESDRDDLAALSNQIFGESEEIRLEVNSFFDPEKQDVAYSEIQVFCRKMYGSLYVILGLIRDILRIEPRAFLESFIDDVNIIDEAAKRLIDMVSEDVSALIDANKSGTIHVPYVYPDGTDIESKYTIESSLKGTILIADDNVANKDMLARQIERQGHTVFSTSDSEEVMGMLSKRNYDLVVMDIMMPKLNGFQLLEKLKADPSFKNIPVIMISALDEIESAVRCIEMGAEDFLPKTPDPVLLRARIGASLEKKRFRDQEQMYVKTILESQRILTNELAEAAEYVTSLLPERISGDVDTDWVFISSAQLGGDCFGYHWLDRDYLAIYLLDVSGHGIGAALLSVSVMNVLRSRSLPETDFHNSSDVLWHLNNAFQMELQNNMYFSIWYGVYNRQNQELTFSAGGSPPGVLISPEKGGGRHVEKLNSDDIIIGVNTDTSYKTYRTTVSPESRLFLFSDGAYEIELKEKGLFNIDGFINVLKEESAVEGSSVPRVLSRIKGLSTGDSFDDDISLLELRF